jgi:DNA-directed RNA polymerase specialized sigma24 family protein
MGKKVYYIDNKRFEEIIPLYLQTPREYEDELMGLFDLLISNIIESFKFNIDKEDAKQECFLLILKTLKNFQPSKGSAFNYFTTVIVNNLKLLYTKNKKYEKKINEYMELKGHQSPSSLYIRDK